MNEMLENIITNVLEELNQRGCEINIKNVDGRLTIDVEGDSICVVLSLIGTLKRVCKSIGMNDETLFELFGRLGSEDTDEEN